MNMSLLSYNRLVHLVETGIITNVQHDQINSASIDVTLGNIILVENYDSFSLQQLSLKDRDKMCVEEVDITDRPFILRPHKFVLAHTQQIFNLPNNISAEYKLKSSMARIGLNHLTAGWCDAGWNGSVLTLELKNVTNYHSIKLNHGDKIGQIIFFEHDLVPSDRSYAARGYYNGDKSVSGVKL
jgi:dCTP deaminase